MLKKLLISTLIAAGTVLAAPQVSLADPGNDGCVLNCVWMALTPGGEGQWVCTTPPDCEAHVPD